MKMSHHSKALFITAIALSAVLAGSALAYLLHTGGSLAEVAVFVAIIVLAAGAVLVTLFTWRIEQRKLSNLGPAFRAAYEQISQAIGASSLKLGDKREVGRDLLDLFSQAESAGKTIEQVVGPERSLDAFADAIIEAHGMKNHIIVHWISGLQCLAGYLIMGQALTGIKDSGGLGSFFQAKMDYTTLLFFTLIALVILPIAFYSKRKIIGKKFNLIKLLVPLLVIPLIVGLVFVGSMELIRAYGMGIDWISRFYIGSVTVIPNVLVLAVLIVIFIGGFLLRRAISRWGVTLR